VLEREACPPCLLTGRTFEVRHLVTPQVQLALGLFRRFEVGASLPIGIMQGQRQICDDQGCHGFEGGGGGRDDLSFTSAAVGDLALHFKARLYDRLRHKGRRRFPLDVGAALSFTVPISAWAPDTDGYRRFLGERHPTLRPQLLLERTWGASGRWRTALNLGVLVRFSTETFTDTGKPGVIGHGRVFCYPADGLTNTAPCGTLDSRSLGSQLTYGIGVAFAAVRQRLDLLGEIYGYADLAGNNRGFPLEAVGAVRLALADNAALLFGWGGGVYGLSDSGRQTGGTLWRAFLGLSLVPRFQRPVRERVVVERTEVQKVVERVVERVVEPPPAEPDSDKDGVADWRDACPQEAGLPPDGCPERQFIVVRKEKIDLKEKIHFATNKADIFPDSYPLLDEVVDVLRANPELGLRIEGHTDSRGSTRLNTRLSQARARAVLDYLVSHGIDPRRLSSQGYGPSRPLADNHTETGMAQNRRTEFYIVRP
jgi:outer membrane protein OmpA-like peptidoglycan-associated protein